MMCIGRLVQMCSKVTNLWWQLEKNKKKNTLSQNEEGETDTPREERRQTEETGRNEGVEDIEKLRDAMADWFVGIGALPNQEEAALRTSDQLRRSRFANWWKLHYMIRTEWLNKHKNVMILWSILFKNISQTGEWDLLLGFASYPVLPHYSAMTSNPVGAVNQTAGKYLIESKYKIERSWPGKPWKFTKWKEKHVFVIVLWLTCHEAQASGRRWRKESEVRLG